jgi:hypothetical protein
VPAEQVASNLSKVMASDLDRYPIRIKAPTADAGRGLVASRGLREGEVIAHASSLFFDSAEQLRKFLRLPRNQQFRDRIVGIENLRRGGEPHGTVFAVLIGAAQFVQHYVNIRKAPNAEWEFRPSEGFNEAGLLLRVRTRNACGIAAGADVVVNYGAKFDFAGSSASSPRFAGSLDALFAGQAAASSQGSEVSEEQVHSESRNVDLGAGHAGLLARTSTLSVLANPP